MLQVTRIYLVESMGNKMGNACVTGGGKILCECAHPAVTSECTDLDNGSYLIKLDSSKTGIFDVSVKIDGVHVLNSPTTMNRDTSQSAFFV